MKLSYDPSFSDKFSKIKTIEMHTGGEPVRIVTEGYPHLTGSILQIRNQLLAEHDSLRKAIMWEPRGHADMYGLLVVAAERNDSAFGVIFMHNAGYSTMCGHATLAITNCAVQLGWIKLTGEETVIKIDAPCGQLTSYIKADNSKVTKVAFENVPSFVVELDATIKHHKFGNVTYDLAYGGAFYAYIDVAQLDLNIEKSNYRQFLELGKELKKSIIEQNSNIKHPFERDLSFLYGVIFIQSVNKDGLHSKNVCVFADGEVDRSATGSGVSGRAAIHYARKELQIEEEITIESIVGSRMSVKVMSTLKYGPYDAVIPRVSGDSYFLGANEFWLDSSDEIGKGFFLR